MPTTYVTTAIPYVNAEPHIGHAYEYVQADVYARARRLAGDDVKFLGGTDDYSLKNVIAAEAAGAATADYVATAAERFAGLRQPLQLSFDDYVRTSSDPRHRPAVERLWRACAANGDLYRRSYEGDYCIGCEQFYATSELVTDAAGGRRCPDHGTPVERVAETNWFFRLSAYQDHLDRLLSSGELEVHPRQFRDETLSFIRSGLADISVSRSVQRARGWGIPVPDDGTPAHRPDGTPGHRPDPGQVIYVWFDALANYLSAVDFGDPESVAYRKWWLESDHRVHVVGKGIVRFHAVFWPAFLASAGLPAPTRVEVHPYLSVDGAKLSKSSGGATAGPVDLIDRYGADALRWWFARDVSPTVDTNFTEQRLIARANEDLAHGIGNVTKRIVTLAHRCGLDLPAEVIDTSLTDAVIEALAGFDLRGATAIVRREIDALNRELEATKPWTASPDDGRIDRLLRGYLSRLAAIAAAIRPIVPSLAGRLEGGGATDRLPARELVAQPT